VGVPFSEFEKSGLNSSFWKGSPVFNAHNVPNLFILDGSSFVTSARQQPTATIQALAYHAAEAAKAAKKGEL
jgi:choline dehydrogenase-like flavoprotein